MFNCKYQALTLSFNEFHFFEKKEEPQNDEFCLIVLKNGDYTAGEWVSGKFIRGEKDLIPTEDVYAWHSLDRYDLSNCLQSEKVNYIDIGEKNEDVYSIKINNFNSIQNEQLPLNNQYCLLILPDGTLTGGRWHKSNWNEKDGFFEQISVLSRFNGHKVWSWTALSPDEIFVETQEKEETRLLEEELNKNPTTDPELFKYGIDIEVYYDKALEKLISQYPWATKKQMKKSQQWEIVPKSGYYVFGQTEHFYDGSAKVNEWTGGKTADEFIDFLVEYTRKAVEAVDPAKKFKYGYDVEVYLNKAFEQIKKDCRWLTDKEINNISEHFSFRYSIKKIQDELEFVRDYSINGKEDYSVCCSDTECFIKIIVNDYESIALDYNPVVSEYSVPFEHVDISGWNLEKYVFYKLKTGDYKVYVQAGDRSTGSGRYFLILPRCFEATTYDEFLDRYQEIVPGKDFGLFKEDLIKNENLKKFLGYSK